MKLPHKAITIDLVTEAYIKTRDEIIALNKQINDLKTLQVKREQWLLGALDAQKLRSVKTDFGTVFEMIKESVTIGDWDATWAWIKEGAHWEYLNHAIRKESVLTHMGEKRENPPPAGVNYTAIRTVQVRRASQS